MTSEKKISIDEYHAGSQGLSKSSLAMLIHSPSSFHKYFVTRSEGMRSSASTQLGSLVHCLVLEPGEFASRYVVSKSSSKLTKAFKDERLNSDKEVLTPSEYEQACQMRDAVLSHTGARAFLTQKAQAEVSFFWKQDGVALKCRPDLLTDDSTICIDLKTTRDASPEGFKREADIHKYWLSAALTMKGVEAVRGKRPEAYVFICVENKGEKIPEVGVYYATQEEIELGEYYIEKMLTRYKECTGDNHWPTFTTKCEPLGLPWYRKKELERLKEGSCYVA